MQELFACLKNAGVPGDWQHILNQIGMFSYTGLSKPQVQVRIFLMCCSRCCALVADANMNVSRTAALAARCQSVCCTVAVLYVQQQRPASAHGLLGMVRILYIYKIELKWSRSLAAGRRAVPGNEMALTGNCSIRSSNCRHTKKFCMQ